MDLDDDVPAKGGFLRRCSPSEREALEVVPSGKESPGETSVDPPLKLNSLHQAKS